MNDMEMKPQESKEISLQLELNLAANSLGGIKNKAEIYSDSDIDTLSNVDDNQAFSEIIVSVKTGDWKEYKVLTLTICVMLVIGVYAIKKYVVE